MAGVEPPKGPSDSGAESPTTARPLEMDDDDVQESGVLAEDGTTTMASSNPASDQNTAEFGPPKPPRPLTEAQKNNLMLKEAFPTVEDGIIRAVLSASGGEVEPAFNALLEMTDPDAVKNEAPPPQPPRPHGQSSSQVEADELYARQLAQRYGSAGAYEARTSSRGYSGLGDNEAEHSFIDDDLPVIRDNLRKGFLDTQTKFNGWFSNFRKRIEEEFNDGGDGAPHAGQGPGSGPARPSGDYDADHRVLGDDFAGMKLSRGGPALRTSSNQAPYRQHSNSPRPGDSRRVNFKEPSEEVNMYDSSPKVPPKDAPPKQGKTSKWQPLAEVEPAPMGEMDPFSLGDSDEEKDGKDKTKDSKETREAGSDDNERLRKAAAEAMSDSLVEPSGQESDDKGSHAG